jgi:molybdopterin molybdotransferase
MKDMLGRDNVITSAEALGMILEMVRREPPGDVILDIDRSLGRICSEDVAAPEDLPAFARSTVDGYAVTATATFGATETMPAYLDLSGEVFMGMRPDFSISGMNAAKIPTGGMLPPGTDAVVMFEHVQVLGEGTIEVMRPVAPGENVIQAGEDVRKGQALIGKGRRMRPQDIGACSGLGITAVRVYVEPRVSIVSTGDEIVPAGETPETGQVRDINSYVLAGMIQECGCIPVKVGILKDNYDEIRSAIERGLRDSAAVIVSGGTSVGTKDLIAGIIDDLGNPGVLFHGVSIKPGKPIIGGIVGGVPIFGLPGHPAAVGVCFDIFIRPVLRLLSGYRERFPAADIRTVEAKLTRNVSSSQGREEHIRVALEQREDGLWAVPVLGK